MSNELNIALTQTGLTDLVARIFTPNWVQVGGDIAMAEIGGATGRYTGSVPALTLASQLYEVAFYTTTPSPDELQGNGSLLWNVDGDKEGVQAEQGQERWKDAGLDSDDPKNIAENTLGTSYDETSTGITKEVRQVGANTTITRI